MPFLIQISAAVAVTGYFSWRNGQKTIEDLALHLSQEVTDHIENHVQSYTQIPPLFVKINEVAIQTGSLELTNYSAIAQAFWEQVQLSDAVPYIYFGSSDGNFVGVWHESDDLTTLRIRNAATAPNRKIYQLNPQGNRQSIIRQEMFDPRERPWYELAVETGQATWSPIYVFAYPPRLGISYSLPIYDIFNSLLGVISVDLTLTDISNFLQKLQVSDSGHVFIIDRSGNIVASSTTESPFLKIGSREIRLQARKSKNSIIRETSQALLAEYGSFTKLETNKQLIRNIAGQGHFIQVVSFSPQPGLDWLITVVIPKAEFTEYIQANNYTTLAVCFVALIIASIISVITAQYIARPLLWLSKVSESFAQHAISIDFMRDETAFV
ncbi:MAG: histidine kinase, partial [Leptolyngbya sp. SIO3F4]|nr:histidine kinase [Leptolyngbya sp. SIO3F4]